MMRDRTKTTILLPVVIIAIFYWVYILQSDSVAWRSTFRQPSPAVHERVDALNTKCEIPALDPFDPSVTRFFKMRSNPDLKCYGPLPLVVADGLSRIIVSSDINTLSHYEAQQCYYRSITRVGDDDFKTGERHYFSTEANVKDEFILVECTNNQKKVIFRDFFPFITRKPEVEQRVQPVLKEVKHSRKEKLSVILLGLDSVSKSQFLRHMKKTYKFIRKNLAFAEMFEYNKVGSNTFPNILGLFTGKTEDEIAVNFGKTYADVLPLIWKDFAKSGYRTLHAEDASDMSIFNYAKKGFDKPPTDYYFRPLGLAFDHSPLLKVQRGCINRRLETKVILKWTEDLMDTFPQDPVFALSYHTRLSHGSLVDVSYQDKPIWEFLQSLNTKGHLNNSVVIFFGDHGYRYGDFRTTYVGRMEDKLPFAFLLLPRWFPNKYPELYRNAQTNQHRLTTPFDMYATLRSILDLTGVVKVPGRHDRSISLINSQIPENRTCRDATIESQFCACIHRKRASISDPRVYAAAQDIVRTINAMTARVRNICAVLTLNTILDASIQEVKTGDSADVDDLADFLVVVQVDPSEGMFEGTVWYSASQDSYTVDKNIERVSLYGNQSVCIDDAKLKPFCYCLQRTKPL